jgi:DNA sulfur modification protein DndB
MRHLAKERDILDHVCPNRVRSKAMETYLQGELVRNGELSEVANQLQREYHETTVPKADLDSYLEKGWQLEWEYKRSVRLRKKKPVDELLEDEVRLLFKGMGFIEMNKDRNFRVRAGEVWKQVDVFAKDENYAFVVECKASGAGAQIATKDIRELSDLKGELADSIMKHYDDRSIRVRFMIATRGLKWTTEKEELARRKGIIVCKGTNLDYYRRLVNHLGSAAKFQIYSIWLRTEKIPEVIKVPAIRGGKGKEKYYCFVIQPEKLLQIAYVHHRRSTPEELLGSYQRMLKKYRLSEIDAFISEGGHFPNNIILSFREKPTFCKFEKEKQAGEVVVGILELPREYASAWIIDGQHRLYGYADNERKSTASLPVLAFEPLPVDRQARLFVEINKEQKSVSGNLLWDLYTDIYRDSDDEEHQLLRTISAVVKRLNSDDDSPLHDHIGIPSVPSKGRDITNLTINTVCRALEGSKLLKKGEGILYRKNYERTVSFATRRLKAFFDVVASYYPEDWKKGNDGALRTNNGIRVLVILLRQLLRYIEYIGEGNILRKKSLKDFREETERLLSPALSRLKHMSDQERSRIRKETAKALVMENAQRLAWWIREEFEGFGAELLRDYARPIPEDESDKAIEQLVEVTEIQLRDFIGKELVELHGDKWWKQGLPGGVKKDIEDEIERKIRQAPYLEKRLSQFTPKERLSHTTIGHLIEIIKYNPNWKQFESTFKDKEEVIKNLDHYYRLRGIYAHPPTEIDEIAKQQGYWATRWIRKCMGLNKVEEGR